MDEEVDDHDALPCPETVDAQVAAALQSMSLEARSTILEEIHGVASLPPEEDSQGRIRDCLDRMAGALDDIPNKPAFAAAQTYPTSFVNDDAYRLGFLRAEKFDPQKAAVRMVKKLELLSQYFGPVGLQRRLTLQDLSWEAQNIVRNGSVQFLPTRDRTGRMIMMRIGTLGANISSQTRMTVLLYMSQYYSEDVESQKKGMVLVSFPTSNFDPNSITNPEAVRDLRSVFVTAPIRAAAIHICHSDTAWGHFIGKLMRVLYPTDVGVHVRVHIGSVTECQYKLMGFGIPGDQLPITSSECIKTQNHLKWINYCAAYEAALMNQSALRQQVFRGIFCPLPLDVIAGRGPHVNSHPGNIRYRELLESKLELYDKANGAEEKIEVTRAIVMEIMQSGGRFLAKDPGGDWWVPITNQEEARLKVSVGFRDIRKFVKARSSRKKAKNEDDFNDISQER